MRHLHIKFIIFICVIIFLPAYSSNYNAAFNVLLKYEGVQYHDNPKDPGGPTKYGWTLKSYRSTVSSKATIYTIKYLSKSKVKKLYKTYWWEKYGASKIREKTLATSLFLSQVNMGPTRPNKTLQEATNDLCNASLAVDGVLGNRSLEAINGCKRVGGAFPYYLHIRYIKDPKVTPVWNWAKNGLRNRIFHFKDRETLCLD